jgi:hypothetical protein
MPSDELLQVLLLVLLVPMLCVGTQAGRSASRTRETLNFAGRDAERRNRGFPRRAWEPGFST